MIKCTKCGKAKHASAFGKSKKKKNGLRSECKECRAVAYLAKIDENRIRARMYAARNKEAAKIRHARWVELNPNRLFAYQYVYRKNEINRERKALLSREKRLENTIKARERYARIRMAIPPWFDSDAVRDFYASSQALSMWTGEWYEVDHIVPLKSKHVCGLHCAANMQVLHVSENIRKGNRWWPDMWESLTAPSTTATIPP